MTLSSILARLHGLVLQVRLPYAYISRPQMAVSLEDLVSELHALVDVKPGMYRAPSGSSLAGRWTVESVVPAVLLRGDDGHTALVPVEEFKAWQEARVGAVPCDGNCAWGEHERRTA